PGYSVFLLLRRHPQGPRSPRRRVEGILSGATRTGGQTLERFAGEIMRYILQHWRFLVLGGLVATPVLILVGFGMYHLWWTGLAFWVWWPLSASLVLAVFLGWRWQKQNRLLRLDFSPPRHCPE